jgi:hypothetical protein
MKMQTFFAISKIAFFVNGFTFGWIMGLSDRIRNKGQSSKLDFRIYWPENFKIRIFI